MGPDKTNPFTHIHDALQYPIVALTLAGVDFRRLRQERDRTPAFESAQLRLNCL